MGSNERLKKLEATLPPERGRGESDEAQRRREWLTQASLRRDRDRDQGEFLARDIINLLRYQGRLPQTADALRARLFAWTPALDRGAIERAVEKAIYESEPGTENMVCDPEWFAAFEAREELVNVHGAVPVEVLARLSVEEPPDEDDDDTEVEQLGLTDALFLRAAGPDVEDITAAELHRRLRLILHEDTYGPRAFEIARHIARLQTKETT